MGLAPGSRIDQYVIEEAVGKGSMGDVFRGLDVNLERPVAIKILSERHRDNRELEARFVREGRAVAAISHPNVVQVFSTGTYDERPYIAMEFLRGVDLSTLVKRSGRMSILDATSAALDTGRGLQAAANAGLIHRDVKPSNLVLLEDGRVKVTDFGLAKPMDPGKPALTAMGVVVGTPDYIAPEQARGETIDHRVDIYALGGSLFFLLTGIPPYRKGNPVDDKYLKVVARHLKNPVPDPRVKAPEIDGPLADLCMAMMAKDPARRPSYSVLIAELEAIKRRLGEHGHAPSGVHSAQFPTEPNPTPFVGGQKTAPAPKGFTSPKPAHLVRTHQFAGAPTSKSQPGTAPSPFAAQGGAERHESDIAFADTPSPGSLGGPVQPLASPAGPSQAPGSPNVAAGPVHSSQPADPFGPTAHGPSPFAGQPDGYSQPAPLPHPAYPQPPPPGAPLHGPPHGHPPHGQAPFDPGMAQHDSTQPVRRVGYLRASQAFDAQEPPPRAMWRWVVVLMIMLVIGGVTVVLVGGNSDGPAPSEGPGHDPAEGP